MSSKKGKKKSRPDIPKELKSSLTSTMRSELAEETFDNPDSRPPDAPVPPTSALSECSTQKSETAAAHVSLQPALDDTIHYINDVVSVYEGTCGTISFESMGPAPLDTVETEELPKEDVKVQQLKMVQLRKIPMKMDEEVNEEEFIRGTTVGGKLLPGVVQQIRWGRGEGEMHFLQEIVNDMNTLVAMSGRSDILLQYSIQFENNHLPILKLSLGKKPSCEETPREPKHEKEEIDQPPAQGTTHASARFANVLGAITTVANAIPS